MTAPASDGDVAAYTRGLGIPGIIDVHVHFMPHNVLAKVWKYFDDAGPLTGREWPIQYRDGEQERLDLLRAMGVRHFTSLVYPHKPEMAAWLNDWAADFAAVHDDVLQTFTFYPEDGAVRYVTEAIERGGRVAKLHVQVGDFDVRDPLLDGVWALLADARIPVVAHVGSGPVAGRFTGTQGPADVLARHPDLCLVIAHFGRPEMHAFLDLADRYEQVFFDTSMAFVDFTIAGRPPSERALERIRSAGERGRVLFGSDFPNIPHSYAHGVASVARLGCGDGFLREVLWDAPARLLGIPSQ